MLLSICVPTYNRGHKALVLAYHLLELQEKYPEDIEIVFSNNGSTIGCEEYQMIAAMAGENFIYFEFPENMMYVGNYNQVIRLSHGDFCLMLSDEDRIYVDNLSVYLEYLKANPNIGMVRARTDKTYLGYNEDSFALAGQEAVKDYFLQGNYISGIIYNRRVLTNEVVDKLENDYKGDFSNRGYFYYPHLFVEAILLISRDFYRSSLLLIHEDEAVDDQPKDVEMAIPQYATWEERVAQLRGYLQLVENLRCSDGIKLRMIVMMINKTFGLIWMTRETYEKKGINLLEVVMKLPQDILQMLDDSNIAVAHQQRDLIAEYTYNFVLGS